jgi:hypothetical protein
LVGLSRRGISPSQSRYLYRTKLRENKIRQKSMPRVGFKPTIRVFERAKTFHILDNAATVIGAYTLLTSKYEQMNILERLRHVWKFNIERILNKYDKRMKGGFTHQEQVSVACRCEHHKENFGLIKSEGIIVQSFSAVNLYCTPCPHIPYFPQLDVVRELNFCGTHTIAPVLWNI